VKNLLGGDTTMKMSRSTEIMANAAYYIFTSDSKSNTGNNFIDDEIVGTNEGPDMTKYKISSDVKDHELIIDFFC
jgi:citronellol/citronellal dehydrogenase